MGVRGRYFEKGREVSRHTRQATDVPELHEVLAYEFGKELAKLLPTMLEGERKQLELKLIDQCRLRAGGNRLPSARSIAADDLASSDPAYDALQEALLLTMSACSSVPPALLRIAVIRLLDVVRNTLGGLYFPKGRSTLTIRDEAMWRAYRGNCRATAIQFSLSSERVRQLMVRRLRTEIDARQGDLFDATESTISACGDLSE